METPAEFTARYRDLMRRACPTDDDTPFFNQYIREAKILRMTYMEGLEYVIGKRLAG